jgi:CheY-like chemotaxis protein
MGAPPGKSPPVVLVVEDEPLLRMLAVEVVEAAGFVALEAGNADEAVALLEARSDISLHGDRHARNNGRIEAGSRGAWSVAPDQDPACVGPGSASALRASVEQSLCRKAIPRGGNGRGTAFARPFLVIERGKCPPQRDSELFCSDLPT